MSLHSYSCCVFQIKVERGVVYKFNNAISKKKRNIITVPQQCLVYAQFLYSMGF